MENCSLERCKGKNWVATMALCWFLGLYGAHRFYTGKTDSGIIMIVLTVLGITAPITAIWALVDGFAIALGKFTHEDGSELYEKIDWFGYLYIALMILAILGVIAYIGVIITLMGAAISAVGSGAGAGVTP